MATTDDLYTALQSLTRQLQQQNDFYRQQTERASATPPGARMPTTPSGLIVTNTAGAPQPGPYTGGQQATAPSLPPTNMSGMAMPSKDNSVKQDWADFKARRQAILADGDFNGNATAQALREYAPQATPAPQSNVRVNAAATPSPSNARAAGGLILPPGDTNFTDQAFAQVYGQNQGGTASPGAVDPTLEHQAITMAMLGEHGAPGFLRNAIMTNYGIQASMNWAQNAGNWVQGQDWMPDTIQNATGTVQGALTMAQRNPLATFLGVQGVRAITGAVGNINDHLANAQNIGASLGYGAGGNGAYSYFGFRNPFNDAGTAARVGLAFDMERQALMGRLPGQGFGSGMSNAQAQSTLDVLANQGFGMNPQGLNLSPTGDAATIAQGLFRPLMTQMPGLGAQELGQFTPELRNAQTSVQQLRETLQGLGADAQSAKEPLDQFTSSVAQTKDELASMGASSAAATGAAMGYSSATGLDPSMLRASAANPMFQGLMLSQGVLPSGIGNVSGGTLAQTQYQMLRMLQGATGGLNRNVYRNVNGQRVLVESGRTAQLSQIAQMSGLPESVVQRILGQGAGGQARDALQQNLGSATQGTGYYQLLNQFERQDHGHTLTQAQDAQLNRYWNATIGSQWKGTGIGQKEMERISQMNPIARAKALQEDIAHAAGKAGGNQIQGSVGNQKVSVEIGFKGQAANMLTASYKTIAQNIANAGGTAYNAVVNAPGGDPQAQLATQGTLWRR